jgi:ATP-dependent Lon protease
MSTFDPFSDMPVDFSTVARLFPLPNFVMFPGAVQPLHIFETRYCEMLEDALADDKLIAMALLEPGWEVDYHGRPPVASVVCIGRVATHVPTGDGKHDILLAGLCRAKIVRERAATRSFRTADVEVLDDRYPAAGTSQRPKLQQELIQILRDMFPKSGEVRKQFEQLLGSQLPLGALTDIIAFSVDLDIQFKQQLLSELNVDGRAEMLLAHFQRKRAAQDEPHSSLRFPPDFSEN